MIQDVIPNLATTLGVIACMFSLLTQRHLVATEVVREAVAANEVEMTSGLRVVLPDIVVSQSTVGQERQMTWLNLLAAGRAVEIRNPVRLGSGRYQAELVWRGVFIGKTLQKLFDRTSQPRSAFLLGNQVQDVCIGST